MTDAERQALLGAFVRAHRERTAPDPRPGRRRTPGLRREELAARAGISATWYAWIEQGRDVRVSPYALGRLAEALQLSRAERAYLFELAGRRDPDAAQAQAIPDAPASLVALVEALPHPAYGLDRAWDACCWNAAAARLFRGWLDGSRERNLLRYFFLDPSARALLPDWTERARRLLAEFRADFSRSLNDPRLGELIAGLCRDSPLFAEAWEAQDVLDREGGARTFRHPEDGDLCFLQHTLTPAERADYKLVVLQPAPAVTRLRPA